MADTPKTPDPEPIIELIETVNLGYVLIAFLLGAALVALAVYALGQAELRKEQPQ